MLRVRQETAERARGAPPREQRIGCGHPGDVTGFDADASASASGASNPKVDLIAAVERVTIRRTTLDIQLAEGIVGDLSDRVLVVPWTPTSPHRRREIIHGESASARPSSSARTTPSSTALFGSKRLDSSASAAPRACGSST